MRSRRKAKKRKRLPVGAGAIIAITREAEGYKKDIENILLNIIAAEKGEARQNIKSSYYISSIIIDKLHRNVSVIYEHFNKQ